MAVDIVSGINKLVDSGGDKFAEEVRIAAARNAPYETGMLAGSIIKIKNGVGSYTITTNAVGFNGYGFAYPAHIEAGEGVKATRHKALHFYAVPAGEVFTKSTKPSAKSHFMRNTVSMYGGH